MIRSHGLCQACRSKELTPKKKTELHPLKQQQEEKVREPGFIRVFRLMLEELSTIRMSMTGKAIHFPTVCNVCHILPKGYISRLLLAGII